MEKIVKILCVCAVLLVGGLGARFTEAKALAGAKHAAPSIIELLWEVEDWGSVKDRLSGWLRQAYSWISPSGTHLFLPNDAHLYQVSGHLISTNRYVCDSVCINPGKPRALDLEGYSQAEIQELFENARCLLPSIQVLAEQRADRRFSAQPIDDLSAFEMNKAPGFQGSWLACEKATSK